MNKTDNIITRLIDKVNANTDSINAIKRALSIKSLEPQTSSSSSGEFTDDHSQLINRDAADAHPMSAVTNLTETLNKKITSNTIVGIERVTQDPEPSSIPDGWVYLVFDAS